VAIFGSILYITFFLNLIYKDQFPKTLTLGLINQELSLYLKVLVLNCLFGSPSDNRLNFYKFNKVASLNIFKGLNPITITNTGHNPITIINLGPIISYNQKFIIYHLINRYYHFNYFI